MASKSLNGQRQAMLLEHVEGFEQVIMHNFFFASPDRFLIFSNSSIDEVVIDMALEAKRQNMPINGRDPARGVAGNFIAQETGGLGKEIRAGLVVPCHYEMFEFNTVSPQGFVAAAETIGCSYQVLKAGERLSL
jgi:SIS domain